MMTDYTTADEINFIKGMGVKHKNPMKNFSTIKTPRRVLLQKYLKANKNRVSHLNNQGNPAIKFDEIFQFVNSDLENA